MCMIFSIFLLVCFSVFFFFFFSSRRRHTRLTCDWSSDVCSSDLAQRAQLLEPAARVDVLLHELFGGERSRRRGCDQHRDEADPRNHAKPSRKKRAFWHELHSEVGSPSRNTPPVGPDGGSLHAQRTEAAPFATGRGAPGPPLSVRTQPGSVAFTRIARGRNSSAKSRVMAFSVALLAP